MGLRMLGGEPRGCEELLYAFFEDAPEAIFLSECEGYDCRWTLLNEAGCRMLGYEREELVGTRLTELCPLEDAEQLARQLDASVAAPGRSVVTELRMRRKDGATLHLQVRVKTLPDGRGYAMVRDGSGFWMHAVFEQSPVGLALMHGPRFAQLQFNVRAEQMLGRPRDQNGELRERLHGLDGQPTDPERLPIVEALRGKRVVGAEFLARNVTGGLTPIGLNAGPIVGPGGEVVGAIAVFEDITANKELERLRAEWSSVVAHDLRQPLGSIALNAQALSRSTDEPKLRAYADRIGAAAARLSRMVGDLMDLSRLDASRLELSCGTVDVLAIVRDCAEQASMQWPGRPIDIRAPEVVPEAYGDPDRLAQVIENLLSNAAKYGRAGTAIVIAVEPGPGELVVSVTNEGRTLSPEEMEHIFERFRRTASAKREGIQGAGLGLYIARALVEAHGGRIGVESTQDGVTTFRFTLPLDIHRAT